MQCSSVSMCIEELRAEMEAELGMLFKMHSTDRYVVVNDDSRSGCCSRTSFTFALTL